jgi:hypothetical protein
MRTVLIALAAAVIVAGAARAAGCRAVAEQEPVLASVYAPDEPADQVDAMTDEPSAPPPRAGLPEELNSPRAAAMMAATLPPLQAPARQEVELHAALYRAAREQDLAGTDRFILEPAHVPGLERLRLTWRELQIRVLASMIADGRSVAWSEAGRAGNHDSPGTGPAQRPATLLRIEIRARDPELATVRAVIGAETIGVGSSRQAVTAIWDGAAWQVRRTGALLVW